MKFLLVFIGGGLGAAARFGVSETIKTTSQFPWNTFAVNLVGCFLIGLLSYYAVRGNQTVFLLGIVGFLGGFTTFSSYGIELFRMIETQEWKTGISYFLLSNVLGIMLVYIGYMVSSNWLR
jgi:CrcB protein